MFVKEGLLLVSYTSGKKKGKREAVGFKEPARHTLPNLYTHSYLQNYSAYLRTLEKES
jgi:hypothetical protein